jgi:hypothetical protein
MSHGFIVGLCIVEFILGLLNLGFIVLSIVRKKPVYVWVVNVVGAVLCLMAGFLLALKL